MRTRSTVLGSPIDVVNWPQAVERVLELAKVRESKYVCACNVHVVVTAKSDQKLADAIAQADLATPDGMPIAWSIRRAGYQDQRRINGPDLMLQTCMQAVREDVSIFLLGSSPSTLEHLREKLLSQCRGLQIAGSHSPPFRPLSDAEESAIVSTINESGAGIVFIGLGCPKQELWMQRQRGKVHAVMIGVGAAFDYHAGTLKRAPNWMQGIGLEWLFRLMMEPRRLWRRYLVTNSVFVAATTAQMLGLKK